MPPLVKGFAFWLIAQLPLIGGLSISFDQVRQRPVGAFVIFIMYHMALLLIGFVSKVWGKLEQDAVNASVDWPRMAVAAATSRFGGRYNHKVTEYLLYFLPEKERESLTGDLEEEYWERYEKLGKRKARAWYWGQVITSFCPLITGTIKKRVIRTIRRWIF